MGYLFFIHMKKSDVYKKQALAAAGTGLVMTLSNPFDLIRTRLQTMGELLRQNKLHHEYRGVFDCVRRIINSEGFIAFWKGNGANLLRFYPSETFNFLTKEAIQAWVRKSGVVSERGRLGVNFLSGVVGAWIVFFFIYPFDFARTQLANDFKGEGTIRAFIKKTYQMEGFRGVYRGGMITFLLAPMFRGFYFGIFDTVKQINPSLEAKLLGGYIGSFIAIGACYPLDTVRRRMIMTACQNYKYDGLVDCWKYVYRSEGWRGFFRGSSIISMQSLSCACTLFLYDKIANDLRNLHSLQN